MAGRCRIKIVHVSSLPFWMLVDSQECPRIADVIQKVQMCCENVSVTNLLLDGCVLPPNESSELLRDNDELHVEVREAIHSVQSFSTTPVKKHKRKRTEDQTITKIDLTDNAEKTVEDPSDSYKEIEKKKHKPEKEMCEEKTVTESQVKGMVNKEDAPGRDSRDSLQLQSYLPVTCETLQGNISSRKKKKKQKEKCSLTEPDQTLINACKLVGHSVLAASEGQRKNDFSESSKDADESVIVGGRHAGSLDSSMGKNKKRRRRHKKSQGLVLSVHDAITNDQNKNENILPSDMPAPLRLSKWLQPKSKKIVFLSDEESEIVKNKNNAKEKTEVCDSPVKLSSHQVGFGSYSSNNLTGEPFCSSSTSVTVRGVAEAVNCSAHLAGINGNREVNGMHEMFGNTNRQGNKCLEENGPEENISFRYVQYPEDKVKERNYLEDKINERNFSEGRIIERNLNEKKSSVDKLASQHEIIQASLADYLKLSPEDRGVKLPPYMKAKRLLNGAIVYTRTSACEGEFPMETSCHQHSTQLDQLYKLGQIPSSNAPVCIPLLMNNQPTGSPLPLCRQSVRKSHFQAEDSNSRLEVKDNCNIHRTDDVSSQPTVKADNESDVVTVTPLYREYSLFPDLTAAPKVGDQIAYKILEMREDYTPGISEYKEAEVLQYDTRGQCVLVRLLHSVTVSSKKKTAGKFEMSDEENDDETEVMLELSSLLEPKLLASS